jgi:hypothetical protein
LIIFKPHQQPHYTINGHKLSTHYNTHFTFHIININMSRNLSITEPHPSVPKSGGYIGGGRGGAGNYQRYKSSDLTSGPTANGPASRISLSKPVSRTVPAGRGGAGNMYHESEAIFQFDEEMIKKRETHSAPVYHIGRGGAGNLFHDSKKSHTIDNKPKTHRSDSNSSAGSSASVHSASSAARAVLGSVFGRRSA